MLSNGAVKSIYQLATGIKIFSHDGQTFDVGDGFGVHFEVDMGKWAVTRRWTTYDNGTGGWDAGHDFIDADDGGGKFDTFESALRTALSLEFDARLDRAYSEIGEAEQVEET